MDIPISYCKTCKEKLPVIIKDIDLSEIAGEPGTIQLVFCPVCANVLSLDEDCTVEWYSEEELPKVTRYKVKEDNGND